MNDMYLNEDPIDRETLERELERLSPFLHDIELPFGLRTVGSTTSQRTELEETRLQDLIECVLDPLLQRIDSLSGLSVLEVACNCGGLAIEAAKAGAKNVLGTDIVAHYIAQALLLKRALGIRNVDFRVAGIDASPGLGRFDVAICCGLLYHLENPVSAMRALAEATEQVLVLDTQILTGESAPLWHMNIQSPVHRDSLLASTGLWRHQEIVQFKPSVEAVLRLLSFLGFKKVEALPVDVRHGTEARRAGAVRTFIAFKDRNWSQ